MTKVSKQLPDEYVVFLADVKACIRAYCDLPKVQPLAQTGWSDNLMILRRCKDLIERKFCIRMTLCNNHLELGI